MQQDWSSKVWRYLRVLQESGEFFVYDPALDRVVDLDTDLADVLQAYGGVMAAIPWVTKDSARRSKRPWWKFW